MVSVELEHFSIEQICESGQCFRMKKLENGKTEVIAKGKYLLVYQDGNRVDFECSKDEYEGIWRQYFDIDSDTDYQSIIDSIEKKDLYLNNAAKYGDGIRILNQDLFEMIISFIISQRNNIKRIRNCIRKLCEQYGEKRNYISEDGEEISYFDFPTAEALSTAQIEDIKKLGVGYRDEYIKRAAEDVVSGILNLDLLRTMSYKDSKDELLKLYGIGQKVADCICLFALHHTDAFPMDTHIISIVNNEYNGEFPFEKYKGYAGVLQQYMFFYDLKQ